MVLDDRRQLPAVFFVWKSIDDSSEDGKDAAECERRWPVLGGWNCAKFPSDCVKLPFKGHAGDAICERVLEEAVLNEWHKPQRLCDVSD